MTLTEKILARTAARSAVTPGETVWVVPDLLVMYDYPGVADRIADFTKNKLGIKKLPLADRTVVFMDHMIPPGDEKEAELHNGTRKWAQEQNIPYYDDMGIGHQVSVELGLALPGRLIIHHDPHVQTMGALGSLPFGLTRDLMTAMSLGEIWLDVPETIQVELTGAFKPGVGGRDLLHKLIYDHGPGWAIGAVLEFVGPGTENVSIDQRMDLLAQVCFTGAGSGIFVLDGPAKAYLAELGIKDVEGVYTDEDATIKDRVRYDLSELTPYLAAPDNPGNIVPIEDCLGIPLTQGYIGSCASGRLEDLEVSATILKGRKTKKGFHLYVVPTSRKIMIKAIEKGYLGALVEAGAFISSPTCDYCYGKTQCMAAGERAISTGTLNVPGRMGSVESEIYLASAATVAASALAGEIADPRKLLS